MEKSTHENKELRKPGMAFLRFMIYVIAFVVLQALLDFVMREIVPKVGLKVLLNYEAYIRITFWIIIGYLLVNSFAKFVYWSFRQRYEHPEASMIESLIKILGMGSILVGVSGAISGGAIGIALGGFMGMVIGFASQQVLSQALAGLFILLAKPIKIGERVTIGNVKGVIENITTLYTHIRQDDGSLVLIPNNSVLGQKIVKLEERA